MNRNIFYILLSFSWVISACHPKSKEAIAGTPSHEEQRKMSNFQFLKTCMTGFFTSEDQSKNDSSYFNIHLTMTPIWTSDEDEFYLFVAQAMSTTPNEPYRVRIYKVVKENEQSFVSYIYNVPNEKSFVGKKGDDPAFNEISPKDITEKEGCAVRLIFDPKTGTFSGGTGEKTCASDRNGAKWATSKVTISEDKMISWDQGWDDKGVQVWGAKKGGYIFVKQK
ncbi:MAG: chromophore lyase CpcT/CpeT [Flavobacteriales bacterium]|nr:chromophore lyase CpcT/CpeT [Flavobacteriales bacterium]